MDVKDLKTLLDAIAKTETNELMLETGDYKLSVKRGQVDLQAVQVQPIQVAPAQVQPVAQPQPPAPAEPQARQTPASPSETSAEQASNLAEITAPIVGTFYESPSPDAPPFVKIGDKVETGKVLCIIEAMKLMNEIEAEQSGVVREILVKNEEPVEYGQVLFRIEPN